MKREKLTAAARAAVFILILVLSLAAAGRVLKPDFEGAFDAEGGFYTLPENTVETVFIGTSVIKVGISPMRLYEQRGLCSYNLATPGQPLLASYYWLREAERLHPETLKFVVLDVSSLRFSWPEYHYRIAFSEMRLSENKLNAIRDITDNLDDALIYLSDLNAYHTRYRELTRDNFRMLERKPDASLFGFGLVNSQYVEAEDHSLIRVPSYIEDLSAGETSFDSEELFCLDRIRTFCEQRGLRLILTKTPADTWSDADHNAAAKLAAETGLPFLDFNYEPLIDEIGFNAAADNLNGGHFSYRGAFKFTDWFGRYLAEECGAGDVRGLDRYAFMEEAYSDYLRAVLVTELNELTDPCDYLETVGRHKDFSVFIAVRGEAVEALTDSQRLRLVSLGLRQSADLAWGGSYLAVMEDGRVLAELCENDTGEPGGPLTLAGTTADGASYVLRSGGYNLGDIASCIIDGTECAANVRGINVVIYDRKNQRPVMRAEFDTSAGSLRPKASVGSAYQDLLDAGTPPGELTGVYRNLYLYTLRCDYARKIRHLRAQLGADGLVPYLEAFREDKNAVIILALQAEEDVMPDGETRAALASLGLEKLARLKAGEAYAAVIRGSGVTEVTSQDAGALFFQTDPGAGASRPAAKEQAAARIDLLGFVTAESKAAGGGDAAAASIRIDGAQCAPQEAGINLVLYHPEIGMVLDARSFSLEP